MSVSILVVDDEPDVTELFCQHFRREARQGTYVMHFAASAEKACPGAADRRDRAQRGGDPLGHQHAEHGRPAIAVWDEAPGNQSYRFERGDKADVDAAFAAAAHIVEMPT